MDFVSLMLLFGMCLKELKQRIFMESSTACHKKTWVYLEEMVCISFLESSLLLWNSRNWNKITRGWERGWVGSSQSNSKQPARRSRVYWACIVRPALSLVLQEIQEMLNMGSAFTCSPYSWRCRIHGKKTKIPAACSVSRGVYWHQVLLKVRRKSDGFQVMRARKMSQKR